MLNLPKTAPEQQAIDLYRQLQQGRIDRTLLAPNLNDYFTPEALADFQSSLSPLGEPLTFHQTHEELRGGMTFRIFEIDYPGEKTHSHHLHLPRRQAGAVPDRTGRVVLSNPTEISLRSPILSFFSG